MGALAIENALAGTPAVPFGNLYWATLLPAYIKSLKIVVKLERANGFEPSTLTLATSGFRPKAADLAVFLAKPLRTLEEQHTNKCERTPKVLPSFGGNSPVTDHAGPYRSDAGAARSVLWLSTYWTVPPGMR